MDFSKIREMRKYNKRDRDPSRASLGNEEDVVKPFRKFLRRHQGWADARGCCTRLCIRSVLCDPNSYFQALPICLMESLRSKCKTLINSINCFGYRKSGRSLVVEVDEPSKGLKIQGKVVKKGCGSSDGFWSTSTCDLDHNITIRSQPSNPPVDPRCSTSNSTESVNHGLALWNQTRRNWRECRTNQRCRVPEHAIRRQPVNSLTENSCNATYDSLLSTSKPFTRPIPLQDMVHFLVDVWEEEGLYM